MPDFRLLAHVECQRQSGRIVGDIEDYRMGIICDRRCPNNLESGAIVDYHRHKFQYIDQYKHAVVVVGLELECMLNHFVQKTYVPPEFQGDGKSSSAF